MFHDVVACSGNCGRVEDRAKYGTEYQVVAWCCKECREKQEEETKQHMTEVYGIKF